MFSVGPLETNGFIIEEDSDAVVIDPGDEAYRFTDILQKRQLTLQAILLTHGHGDHIGGLEELHRNHPEAKVMCHRLDSEMLTNPAKNLAALIGKNIIACQPDAYIEDGEILTFGKLTLTAIHVPGHTRGHLVFKIGKELIAGDTVFSGGIGRWDLPGGNGNLLIQSIRAKILTLPDDTRIYPGHGPVTTVGEERRSNPYLNPYLDPSIFSPVSFS